MLKQLLISFFILFNYATNIVFAQDTTKTKSAKWGAGVQVNTVEKLFLYDENRYNYNNLQGNFKDNSWSLGLNGIHFLSEKNVFRFKIELTNINLVQHIVLDSINGSDGTSKQKRYFFALGGGWKISKNNFNFFGGFELPFTLFKSFFDEGTQTYYDNGTLFKYYMTQTTPGGYSIGIGSFIGFNILPVKHISIGTEFSSAYVYYSLGGTIVNTVDVITPANNPSGSDSHIFTLQGFPLTKGKLSFNIAYLF